jgi:hypothetical protein
MMPRAINIAEWTAHRGDKLVHVHASLTGNSVTLFECEETPSGIGRDCVEMPGYVLREIVARMAEARVEDERQGGLSL